MFHRKPAGSLSSCLTNTSHTFFQRDDVSRLTSGKKQTLTFKKVKRQKQLLNDTLKNLHQKFMSETTTVVSYSLFCRLRPFWVVAPLESDRDTCQCNTHENLALIASKPKTLKIIPSYNLEELAADIACDADNKTCMYGEYRQCKDSAIIDVELNKEEDEVSWLQWVTVKEKRKIKEEVKEVSLVVKKEHNGTLKQVLTLFQEQLLQFKSHHFNIVHQYRYYRHLRQHMV